MTNPTDAVTPAPTAAATGSPAGTQDQAARLFSLSIVVSGATGGNGDS